MCKTRKRDIHLSSAISRWVWIDPGVLVNSSTITGRPAAAGSVIYTELQIVLVDYFPKGLLLRLLFPRRLITFPFIL